jgi:hypothetical protein
MASKRPLSGSNLKVLKVLKFLKVLKALSLVDSRAPSHVVDTPWLRSCGTYDYIAPEHTSHI